MERAQHRPLSVTGTRMDTWPNTRQLKVYFSRNRLELENVSWTDQSTCTNPVPRQCTQLFRSPSGGLLLGIKLGYWVAIGRSISLTSFHLPEYIGIYSLYCCYRLI